MVAFAAVTVAFCAQAVSVDWSVDGVQINGDWDQAEGDSAPAGWQAYLFDASAMTAVTTALAAENNLEAFQTVAGSALDSAFVQATGAIYGSTSMNVDSSNNVNGFLVLLDAAAAADGVHAFVSDIYSTESTDPVPTTFVMGEDGWINGLDHDIAGQAGSNWTTLQSVPEPTSGLLLLLGVAGLALRRRRA